MCADEDDFGFSGVTGGCELPDMGARNLIHVLWKSRKLSISPAPSFKDKFWLCSLPQSASC